MKLSTKGQYAVVALVDLAAFGGANPVSLETIAKRQNLPLAYLVQLFVKLRAKGLVKSVRGQKGGYVLASSSNDIAIFSIIQAVDEPIQVTRCQHGSSFSCQGKTSRCLTHSLWDNLAKQIKAYLASVTLADICAAQLNNSKIT